MKAILSLTNVSIRTPEGHSLCEHVNLSLAPSEILLLEGDNGSGKTTLVKTMLGLYKLSAGEIEKKFSDDQVTYVPQLGNIQFFLPLTILDVITLDFGVTHDEIQSVGLLSANQIDRLWNSASGGERQKALLTRAFTSSRNFLVLDEPFNHIDKNSRAIATRLIKKACARGATIVLISHESVRDDFPEAKFLNLNLLKTS